MKRSVYKPLPLVSLSRQESFVPQTLNLSSVTVDSPALHVMTDLTKIPAATITVNSSLAETNQAMIRRGVRMLFVTDASQHLLGVITVTDLSGEKPVLTAQRRGIPLDEVTVEHIMTPVENLEAVSMTEVSHAEVGHIVATLKAAGRQHAIAVERDASGRLRLRGIFSVSQIARQLGVPIVTAEVARTFAEIEAVFSGA